MKTTHTKQNKISTGRKSKSLVTGSIVAIIIATTPYIFYLYESFPDEKSWETFLFTFKSSSSLYNIAWLLTGKVVPLVLLILWFFTCRDWWYHVILIPIAMYAFQIFSIIHDENNPVDEVEIYWLIPIMMIIMPIVYLIRLKLFDKYVYGIDLKKIDAELAEYERKEQEMLEANK
ncbi:hypothetical protein IMCC3317_03690 [Kordia antarctica]|uniref:Uncharacterized protein n=1 Tax=Kordia antarctica TaxID=1218801 RepID=A0A7L4ZE68_9FLAO|nr:hypothetical protein [Kordia antarctica]QHI35023.1 hypothetical protein IMCC3317_03690 [Kordia antarctica]